jgi:dTDP-glucose 4,6-dehydratase
VENLVMTGSPPRLAADLDALLERYPETWRGLRGARVFVTGGTGFVGCWLLESLVWANDRLGLGAAATVLTRDAAAFVAKAPHLAGDRAVELRQGDVCSFDVPGARFTHVVHAAVEAAPASAAAARMRAVDVIIDGTRRTLEFARRTGAARYLLTSTGAIYGAQPAELERVPEEYCGGPDPSDPATAGAEAKRVAETLCAVAADAGFHPTIARCFAFVGPYLPLDAKFAAGNFVRDALAGGPLAVAGDGSPYRSYMYGGDLAAWLWTILQRGQAARPYNVGSEEAITIVDLARLVAAHFTPARDVRIAGAPMRGGGGDRYVPSTTRARRELGLTATVTLEQAIARTLEWYGAR